MNRKIKRTICHKHKRAYMPYREKSLTHLTQLTIHIFHLIPGTCSSCWLYYCWQQRFYCKVSKSLNVPKYVLNWKQIQCCFWWYFRDFIKIWTIPWQNQQNDVCPAKTQISLGIRPVWSESSQCTQWVAEDPMFPHVESEDSDQTSLGAHVILLVLSCGGSYICLHGYLNMPAF